MMVFFISFAVISLAILGLAVSVLAGRGPLTAGGCGGIGCRTAGFGCEALCSPGHDKQKFDDTDKGREAT